MAGVIKLSQDMAKLINNHQDSDIQFKVGGGTRENSETVTIYAHSCILRYRSQYFATMLDEEKNSKEGSKSVIYKPNISPGIFQDVLHYIYTGNARANFSENIIELIEAAHEMDLEGFSIACQDELIRIVENIFSDDDNDDENEDIGKITEMEESTTSCIPIDVAIRTYIIPVLSLPNNHSLSHLSEKLLTIILPSISLIIKSPNAYPIFINNISSDSLARIIASDDLTIAEKSVWNFVLDWACHQTDLSKAAVEARLNTLGDDEANDEELPDGAVIGHIHLNQLKKTVIPFLPAVRFSLLDRDDYEELFDILNYFLPRRQYSKLNRYFLTANNTRPLDTPRMKRSERKRKSGIFDKTKSPLLGLGV